MQGGFKAVESECWELGNGVRQVFKDFGYTSVAADEFAAPGVVVVSQVKTFTTQNVLGQLSTFHLQPPTNLRTPRQS